MLQDETADVDWLIPSPEGDPVGLTTSISEPESSLDTAPVAAIPAAGRNPLVIELPDDDEDGIVRVKVKRDGHRTSVSLDLMFYQAGSLLLGGSKEFESWLQEQVTDLDVGWANRAINASLGDRIRPNAGVSRLIQRRVLQMVIEKASTR